MAMDIPDEAGDVLNVSVKTTPTFGTAVNQEVAPGVYVIRHLESGVVIGVQVKSPQLLRVGGKIVWTSKSQRDEWAMNGLGPSRPWWRRWGR